MIDNAIGGWMMHRFLSKLNGHRVDVLKLSETSARCWLLGALALLREDDKDDCSGWPCSPSLFRNAGC